MKPAWRKLFNEVITSLKNSREAEELLSALFTPAEYDEFVRRWQIIESLIDGESQRAISQALSVSVTTVSRGARELKYGNKAFQKYHDRIHSK